MKAWLPSTGSCQLLHSLPQMTSAADKAGHLSPHNYPWWLFIFYTTYVFSESDAEIFHNLSEIRCAICKIARLASLTKGPCQKPVILCKVENGLYEPWRVLTEINPHCVRRCLFLQDKHLYIGEKCSYCAKVGLILWDNDFYLREKTITVWWGLFLQD